MSIILQLKALSKRFGKQSVLEGIDLSVRSGEFLTLLGPSGSGKTTLLRLVGGFERPDQGQIFLESEEISALPPYKRRVNTVFQSYALFPHLNVWQNIAFGLRNLDLSRDEIQRRTGSTIELVQLAGFQSRMPHQLSGGQQQRVALARALVMQPLLLLLDEPFGALDQNLRQQMRAELKSLQRRLRFSFVLVTHDQEEALSLSDRVALLNQGRLEQVGTPEEIYEHPETRFVADFMGVQNIFAITAVETNGDLLLCRTQGGQVIQAPKANSQDRNFRYFGIRPEKIFLSKEQPANRFNNVLEGRICEGTYFGSAHQWLVRAGEDQGTWRVSQPFSQDSVSLCRFSVEDKVYLCWEGRNTILIS